MEIKSWRELNKKKKKKKILPIRDFSAANKLPTDEAVVSFKQKKLTSELDSFYNKDEGDTIKSETSNIMPPVKKSKFSHNLHKSHTKRRVKKSTGSYAKKFWWVIGFIVVAALVTAIGAWRWAGPSGGSQEFELTIVGPSQVAVGEEAVWVVNYKNIGRVDLLRMELTIQYPPGLKIRSTNPVAIDSLNKAWDIGELKAGEEGNIEIRAQIFGVEGENKKFIAEMVYQPANFSSDFITRADYQVALSNSQLTFDFTGPESTLPETENDWLLKIRNIGDKDLSDTELRLITSNNFRMRESEPEIEEILTADDNKIYLWPRRLIQQQQELTFTWNGKFNPEAKGIEEMKVEIVSYEDGEPKVLQEETLNIPILGEELALELAINDSKELAEVSAGSELDYKITIQNTSGQDLKDLTASLRLTSDYIDWSSLKASAEPEVSLDGLITLSSEKYDGLKLIKSGDKLEFNIKIKVKSQITDAMAGIKASANVKVGMVGDKTKNDLSFSTKTIVTNIKVPLKLYAQARYYDDEGIPIGSGPIPPQVGEQTEYIVSLSLGKTSKSFNKITVSASLPAGVNWGANQQVARGIFGYIPSSRQVTWELNNVNGLDREISAKFKINITPQTGDVGKVLPLLSVTSLSVQLEDGSIISLTAPALDTNLTGELYGSGQGEVISAK